MKIWRSDGHLTELALELWAAAEAEPQRLHAMHDHLETCDACRARGAEWHRLFRSLTSLQAVEPSAAFDAAVMERVHLPSRSRSSLAARWPSLLRRLRPVAMVAAAAWTAIVAGGAWWVQAQVEAPATALLAELASRASGLLLTAVIEVAAFLRITGVLEILNEWAATVPSREVALALSLMTMLSGLAIWTLYRVTAYQPSRVKVNA